MTYSQRCHNALFVVVAVCVSAVGVAAQRVMPTFTDASGACADKPTDVAYVFPATTTLLDKPKPGAARVGTAPLNAIGTITCLTEGYVRVMLPGTKDPIGWFAASRKELEDNSLVGGFVEAFLRRSAMDGKPWTQAVKGAIIRGRVLIGFTPEQVTLALKEPLRRDSEETAAGVTEVWAYIDQSIVFRANRVTAIRKSK